MCLAVPGKVILIDEESLLRMATVDFNGVISEVSLVWLPEAGIGDYVMSHVGTALSIVDEEDAILTIESLRQMGEIA